MKKIILTLSVVVFSLSCGIAMSKDTAPEQSNKINKEQKHQKIHKLVDVYTNDIDTSNVVTTITLDNQDNYNIFYCKDSGWCEVVDKTNGETGWVNLDQLKKAQEKYTKYMHKKASMKKLVKYIQLQDQKIVQLQTMMMQMQKEFAHALQQQQVQINQLSQAYYY
ncbi:hypothetical protein LO80_09570 [Candidatus Francisella endociliophora]|uniref:SH3b domain-containing protein n=1 Tax=Candidatus Francisella endociliophora TaxID=653937 RepID=A0A097ERM2_9GAMM|nr:hypothetical protein LO80_09570 [Francisella sp. FSC1006]